MNGERCALPHEPLSEEAAAELLLAAEQMLALHPTRESIKCARVEALIHCRHYQAALTACRGLMPGSVDAAYLAAEAHWRLGHLNDAVSVLQDAVQRDSSAKCAELMQFIVHLKACSLMFSRHWQTLIAMCLAGTA